MAAMREGWGERCRRLAAMRPPPPEPQVESIAATDLSIGDCFWWGDVHLTVLTVERSDFIETICAGQQENVTLDLHPLEEIRVHIPRPAHQWRNPDDHDSHQS
jgi:hypothetical protein